MRSQASEGSGGLADNRSTKIGDPRRPPATWSASVLALTIALASGCAGPAVPSKTNGAAPPASTTGPATPTAPPARTPDEFHVTAPGAPVVEGGLEFVEWLVGCAAENGEVIEVIYGNPPAIQWTSTRARTEQVVEFCHQSGLEDGWIIPSPFDGSADGNRLMYRLWLPVHECLRANGYPTVDPPSEEAFVDQGSQLWNPYAGFTTGAPLVVSDPEAASGEELRQLEAQAECGASAESLYQEEVREQEEGG